MMAQTFLSLFCQINGSLSGRQHPILVTVSSRSMARMGNSFQTRYIILLDNVTNMFTHRPARYPTTNSDPGYGRLLLFALSLEILARWVNSQLFALPLIGKDLVRI